MNNEQFIALNQLEKNSTEIAEEILDSNNPQHLEVLADYLSNEFEIKDIDIHEFIQYLVEHLDIGIYVYARKKQKELKANE